jgi:hypothetical protein
MSLVATPTETDVLADIARERAAGLDPFGDDEFDPPVIGAKEVIEEADEVVAVAAVADASDAANAPPEKDAAAVSDAEKPVGEGADAAELKAKDDAPWESVEDADAQVAEEPQAAAPELVKDTVKEASERQIPTYQTELPADYQAQRSVLLKEKSLAMKKLIDGELDLDAFSVIESRVSNALEDLTAQRIRSETLSEANMQNQQAMQQSEIRRLIARAKADVDYSKDTKAQKNFDVALRTLQADPDNAALEFGDLVDEAHRVVLALRGGVGKVQVELAAAAAAVAASAVTAPGVADPAVKDVKVVKTAMPVASVAVAREKVPDRQLAEKAPVTLRGLPVASTPNSNGDVIEQMSRLSGQAYQDAFAKLSPQQRRTLVDEE